MNPENENIIIVVGPPSVVTIAEIQEVHSYYKNNPRTIKVAIIKDENGEAVTEYSLSDDHQIIPGMEVEVTPISSVDLKSQGSITRYELKPVSEGIAVPAL